jgi:hypothetical protein
MEGGNRAAEPLDGERMREFECRTFWEQAFFCAFGHLGDAALAGAEADKALLAWLAMREKLDTAMRKKAETDGNG